MYLQARLLELPFETSLVGINCDKGFLSSKSAADLKNSVRSVIASGFCSKKTDLELTLLDRFNGLADGQSIFCECLSQLIIECKKYLLRQDEKAEITADNNDKFANRILNKLPEQDFKISPVNEGLDRTQDILLLTGHHKISAGRAREVHADLLVPLTTGIVTPEAGLILGERSDG